MAAELLLRQVVFPDGVTRDMLMRDGRIVDISPNQAASPDTEVLDGQGHMVAPGFVNAHTHPGQTFVGGPWVDYDYPDTVPGRAKAEAEYLARNGRMDALRCSCVQFREALRRGVTHIRGHLDVGAFGLEEAEEGLQARELFKDVLDVEFIAFPSNGILNMKTDPKKTIPAAIAMGVEGIGGADPCERDLDPVRSVNLTLGLAADLGAKVDLHLHEFGGMGLFSLNLIIKKVRELKLHNAVTISHAWCLANLGDEAFKPIAEAMAELGIGIITHVPGHVPFPSLKQHKKYHVSYGVGTDNMRNLWSPYGMNNMLERVMLLAYLSDFRRRADVETAYDTGTYGSAAVLGLRRYGLDVGCAADVVVFPTASRVEALLEVPLPRFVIKRGRLVVRDGELTSLVPQAPR